MSEITTDTPDLGVAFNIEYWGSLGVYDPAATCGWEDVRNPTISGVLESTRNMNYAWAAMMMGKPSIDPVPTGERFDICNPELSERFHQSPGSVVLVDVETITQGAKDIHERQDAPELFAASASDFLRIVQGTQAGKRDLSAGIRFNNPNGADEWYERRVSLIAFAETVDGKSGPLRPEVGWTVRGLAIKPMPANHVSRGLPVIGKSYARSNDESEITDVRRIRSVDVISGSSIRPPKKVKQKNKAGAFIGSLLPSPAPVPSA